jgi:hypothetical protein
MTTTINSTESLSKFIGDIREAWNRHKFLRVSVKTGKDRSLDYNALSHCWYIQVANELREDDAAGVKAFCKLHFGVPILRAEDADFREFYDAGMKNVLTYEQKVKAMRFVPVTSLMTQAQFDNYAHQVQDHYAGRVALEFPKKDEQPKRRRAA